MRKIAFNAKLFWILAFCLAFALHVIILYIFLLTPALHEVKDKGAFVVKNRSNEIKSVMVIQSIYPGEIQQTQIDQIKSIPTKKIEEIKEKPKKIKEEIKTFKTKTLMQKKEKKRKKTIKKKVVQKVQKQAKSQKEVQKRLSNVNSTKSTASKPISKNDNVVTSTSTGYSNAKKVSWQSLVMAHLSKHKEYPLEALENKQEGIAYVRVTIDKTGKILTTKVKKTSGYFKLDKASLLLIKKSSPLPKPPSYFFATKDSLRFTLPIRYDIKEFLKSRN